MGEIGRKAVNSAFVETAEALMLTLPASPFLSCLHASSREAEGKQNKGANGTPNFLSTSLSSYSRPALP